MDSSRRIWALTAGCVRSNRWAALIVRSVAEGQELLAPDSGTCKVDGIDVVKAPMESRKRLGVLPDAHGLYPRLTPREHVRYFAGLHGIPAAHSDQRAAELFELLGLSALADRRVEGFSHGERTKVA